MDEKTQFRQSRVGHMTITASSTLLVYLFCLLSAVLYSVTKNVIIGYAAGFLICALVFLLSEEDYYIFFFGVQFLNNVIQIQIGPGLYGFTVFAFLCVLVRALLGKKRLVPEYLVLLGLLFLDIVVSTIAGVYKIGDNLNWVFSLAYMVYILKEKAKKIDLERLVFFFVLAEWAICLIHIIAEIRLFGKSLDPNMYGVWIGKSFYAFGGAYATLAGGNGITLYNILAIALCVLMYPHARRRATRIFYLVTILFFGYCGILIVSRAFYIEIALFALMLSASLYEKYKKPMRLVLSVAALAFAAGLFWFLATQGVCSSLSQMLTRFGQGNDNREALIAQSKKLFVSNIWVFLFGAGSNYPEIHGFTAHNILWDSLVSLGILGGLAYWGVVFKTMWDCFRKNAKASLQALIPFVLLFLHRMISGSTRDVGFYFLIALVTLYPIYHARQEKEHAAKAPDNFDTDL